MAMLLSDRLGRRLKLQDLHVLMTVMQTGGMGKAAQRLNLTQPAISRSIAQLEHAFGVRLLDRDRQGVRPTEYGRALLDCGVAVFDDLLQGVKNIEFLADPAAGDVRIGCNPFLAASFGSAVVDRLAQRYPRIVFHALTAPTETLHRALLERDVDLLIAQKIGPFADAQFGFETLYDDDYVVLAGAKNPWARRRNIELAKLVNEAWVLPPLESAPGSVVAQAFVNNGLKYPRVTLFSPSHEMRISLLATGRYLTVLLASVLKFATRRAELKILPVNLRLPPTPIGIVTLKNRTLSPAARLFIEHAREVAKPLARHRR
jgi:DNA-binding transcriptional LysR family regulator